jgi:hypothetical protein
VLGLFWAVSGSGAGEPHHGAHVHGVARLNVALDGELLLIELQSPVQNLLGFEHNPRSAAERAAVANAKAQLENAAALFVPNQAAACTLRTTQVRLSFDAPSQDTDAPKHVADAHEHETEHGHSGAQTEHQDMHAEYRYACAHPDRLNHLEVGLFTAFPLTERLRVQLIAPGLQDARVLTREDARLNL